jgi:hypothetical protein
VNDELQKEDVSVLQEEFSVKLERKDHRIIYELIETESPVFE